MLLRVVLVFSLATVFFTQGPAAAQAVPKPQAVPKSSAVPKSQAAPRPSALPVPMPKQAVIVGAFRSENGAAGLLAKFGMSAPMISSLLADLDQYAKKTLGISASKVQRGAFFVTAEGNVAMLLGDVSGKFAIPVPNHLRVAHSGNWLVLGTPPAVDLALKALAGKTQRLLPSSALLGLAEVHAGAQLFVAADVAATKMVELAPIRALGLTQIALIGSTVLRVEVHGPRAKLTELLSLYDSSIPMVLGELRKAKSKALRSASPKTGPTEDDVAAILGSHFAEHFATVLRPKLTGDTLWLEHPAGDLSWLIGGMAAVAIPAFVNYASKSPSPAPKRI